MKKPLKEKFRDLLSKPLYKSAYSRAYFTLIGVVWKEINVSFRQFFIWRNPFLGIYRVLTVVLSSLIRLMLGRNLKYSFAYTGEDRIIESIYKPLITENGFYVDVGCNHPIFLSNTYGLYRKGWRGICIDANARLIKKFKYYRPKDQAICALVSNETVERAFYVVQNDVLSTTSVENIDLFEKDGLSITKEKTISKTLTSILDASSAPSHIDILSIDAEEHDFEVLVSLDYSKYKPQVIIIEDERFDINQPQVNEAYQFLLSKDYHLAGFVLKNIYFRKN